MLADNGLGDVDMYWASQMNIMRGPWPTPWQNTLPAELVLKGCAMAVHEALQGFPGKNT
jgi:hypothetical protein